MRINVNKEDIEKFDQSDIGKYKNGYLKRSKIIGIILIVFSLFWIILNLYNYSENVFEYTTAGISLLFGIYFIINSNIIKKKEVNKFINSQKTSKK